MYGSGYCFFLALALLHLFHVESMCGLAGYNFLARDFHSSVESLRFGFPPGSLVVEMPLICIRNASVLDHPMDMPKFLPSQCLCLEHILFLAVLWSCTPVHIPFPQKAFLYAPFYQQGRIWYSLSLLLSLFTV